MKAVWLNYGRNSGKVLLAAFTFAEITVLAVQPHSGGQTPLATSLGLCPAQPPECAGSGPPGAWARLSSSTEGKRKEPNRAQHKLSEWLKPTRSLSSLFRNVWGFFSACVVRVFPIRSRRKVTPSISEPGMGPEDGACTSPALQCSETLRWQPGGEVPVQKDNKWFFSPTYHSEETYAQSFFLLYYH